MGYLYFPYSGLLNAIAAFTVGVFVLLKNYKSPINKAYAFFAASVTLWAFNYFLWLISKDASAALFFIRAAMIGAILIPETFLYFVMEFTGKKKFLAHVLNGILIIIFISFSYSPVYIQKVEQRLFFSFWPVPGLLFHFMLAYFIISLIYAHTILWGAWNKKDGAKKEQVKYVLFGIATGFIGGCTNFFLWYNIPFPPYLNILVSGFVIFVATAIVKHQLIDISMIIKKTLVFTSFLACALAIVILPTLLIQEYFIKDVAGKFIPALKISFYTFATGVTALLSFPLGAFVYLRNTRSSLHKTWFVFASSVSVWAFGYFLTLTEWCSHDVSLWCSRMSHASAAFVPVLFFDFVALLLNERERHRRLIKYGYIVSALLCVACFTPLIIRDVVQKLNIKYYPDGGLLYPVFILMYYVYASYGIYRMYYVCKHSNAEKSHQIKYFLFASIIGFAGGASLFFLILNIKVPPFASVLIGLYPVLTSYGILRHKFMGIEVVIKKTITYSFLLIMVFAILLLPAYILQEYFIKGIGFGGRIAGLMISGLIIIFTMRKIEDFLIKLTDRYLFQKKYDYKELLRTFTTEVLTVLNLDRLLMLTVDKLVDIVRISSCAVLLFDREKSRFWVAASYNVSDPAATFMPFNGTVMSTATIHGHILMSDISEKRKNAPDNIKEMADKLSSKLIIPMVLHDKAIGILSLGKKKSDEDYTQDDLDILLPLARTLAIAISNAELFEELGKTQAEAAQKEKMAIIGTLAAGMAHEIRNPITTIKIFTEFLKERKDDPRFIEKFEQLVPKEVEKINDMITHLLEFSKPADYKSVEPVDLREPLNGVLEILEAEMTLSDIILKEHIEMVPRICGNKKYIQEILFNIIQNAIHAIGRRGTISVESEDVGRYVEVRVTDTGCGIAEEHVQHIFEPFFTTKIDSEGVGLGLYVIKQLMLRMGGNISVKSIAGKGTTFYLSFIKA